MNIWHIVLLLLLLLLIVIFIFQKTHKQTLNKNLRVKTAIRNYYYYYWKEDQLMKK